MPISKGNQGYTSLASYLGGKIRESNLLGLSEEQIEAISLDVVSSGTFKEILSWCSDTLLLEDAVAHELICMRRAAGIGFTDDQDSSNSLSDVPSVIVPSGIGQDKKDQEMGLNSNAGRGRQLHARGEGKGAKKKKKLGDTSAQQRLGKYEKKGEHLEAGGTHVDGKCGCFATMHPFWKNCMNCGRIFCEAEKKNPLRSAKGSYCGPISSLQGKMVKGDLVGEEEEDCFFCGLPPSKSVAYAIAVEEGKLTEAAQAKNMAQFQEALARRDRLLEYEKNRSKRTAIIDDQQASLFSPQDAWVSPGERRQAEKNAAEEERKRKIEEMQRRGGAYTVHLDFVNKNVSLGALPNNPTLTATSRVEGSAAGGPAASTMPTLSATPNSHGCSVGLEEKQDEATPAGDHSLGTGSGESKQRKGLCVIDPEIASRRKPLWAFKLPENPAVSSFSGSEAGARKELKDKEEEVGGSSFHDKEQVGSDGFEEEDAILAGAQLRAAAPSPFAFHSIWYSTDGSKVEPSALIWTSGDENAPKKNRTTASKSVLDTTTSTNTSGIDALPTVQMVVTRSKRVQQDYFLEDNNTFEDEWISSHYYRNTDEGKESHSMFMETAEETKYPHDRRSAEKRHPEPAIEEPQKNQLLEKIPYSLRERDEGVCLSMHQPWASLLVYGIKTHEGREWPTSYRGRLWIHAASTPPADIPSVEAHYSQFMKKGVDGVVNTGTMSSSPANVKQNGFPLYYPTKVLLGYVFVVDCLDRESYEAAYPPEERQEECLYSFICVCATPLVFPLPMLGNHKLFTLDHKVHTAAKKQLGEVTL